MKPVGQRTAKYLTVKLSERYDSNCLIEIYLCLEPLLEILVSSSVYYQFDELSGGVCHLTDNSKDFGA